MTFERGNLGYFIAFILIGAILGSSVGTLLARIFPALSLIKESLTGPMGINLEIVSFSIKLNLSAIIGLLLGFVLFWKV
jgi:hypothetical protein